MRITLHAKPIGFANKLSFGFASADADFAFVTFGGEVFVNRAVAVIVNFVADFALWKDRAHTQSVS